MEEIEGCLIKKIQNNVKYFYVYYKSENELVLHSSNDLTKNVPKISSLSIKEFNKFKKHKNIKSKITRFNMEKKGFFTIKNNIWSFLPNIENENYE